MFAVFFDKFDRRSLVAAGFVLAIVAGVFEGSARAQTAPALRRGFCCSPLAHHRASGQRAGRQCL